MSLTRALERGINSATYNPEADKALQEEKQKAAVAKQKYRDGLFRLRDTKTQLVQKNQATDYYIKQIDTLADNGFKWMTANPDADMQSITDQATTTTERVQDVSKANLALLGLFLLPPFYRTVASDALIKKKIPDDKKREIDAFADSLSAWLKTSTTATSEQIFSKQQEVQVKSKDLLEGTGESVPAVTNEATAVTAQQQIAAKEVKVKQEEEADKQTFKLSRLIKETYGIAVQVIGSLFVGLLFLVSGMLAANDAIGRDPQYRILYFLYGGLGFPVLLIYYVYRWFFGTAPYIYRLLPLYTKESDTSLGRFILFPFTYKEDQAAIDAKTAFMTEAAELVGKTYTAPNQAIGDALGSIVEGVKTVGLNAATAVTKGASNILTGLQRIELPK